MSDKTYLGDGLYASFDGGGINLSTPRASGEHYVYLEPEVFEELISFAMKVGWLREGQTLKGRAR